MSSGESVAIFVQEVQSVYVPSSDENTYIIIISSFRIVQNYVEAATFSMSFIDASIVS